MSTLPIENEFEHARAEAFANRMVEVFNHGSLALMLSIGHQTKLFDVMAELSPSSSHEIAEAAGLQERYVREWLGAMVSGHVVEYDRVAGTYYLPPEHAGSLTRAAGVDNFAFFMQYVTLLAGVEQMIIGCFHDGGGVPYAAFPRFQKLQAEETARVYDSALVNRILPIVPGLVNQLEAGIAAADIGTGAGHAVNVMGKAFPRSRFTGYDFSSEGIGIARAEAKGMGLENVRFEVKDAATLDMPGAYDLVTAFDAIHDQVAPREVLERIAASLRPGGVFLMADIAASSDVAENVDHFFGPALYTISCLHCMTVSLAAGGEGLGAMWGREKALELLDEAGFTDVEVREVEGDPLNVYFIARKS